MRASAKARMQRRKKKIKIDPRMGCAHEINGKDHGYQQKKKRNQTVHAPPAKNSNPNKCSQYTVDVARRQQKKEQVNIYSHIYCAQGKKRNNNIKEIGCAQLQINIGKTWAQKLRAGKGKKIDRTTEQSLSYI